MHSGAGQPVRVWPLERWQRIVQHLRQDCWLVQVACDPSQEQWWLDHGETGVTAPGNVKVLLNLLAGAQVFLGNDSGPGHLAALCGLPTFTIFGPQLPEWFAPLHPEARWISGKECPHKPCFDNCRFPRPHCLLDVSMDEVWAAVQRFVERNCHRA